MILVVLSIELLDVSEQVRGIILYFKKIIFVSGIQEGFKGIKFFQEVFKIEQIIDQGNLNQEKYSENKKRKRFRMLIYYFQGNCCYFFEFYIGIFLKLF